MKNAMLRLVYKFGDLTRMISRAACLALLLFTGLPALVIQAGEAPGKHPLTGREYAWPMGVAGAAWLDRPERIREEQPDRALDLIDIKAGSTVADIGAGSGYFTERLARRVGPAGRVYANDIQPGMLDLIEARMAREKLTNIVPVLGAVDDPKLPVGVLDLALMVDVYHEFSAPEAMLRGLAAALKSGGRLVLLEYRAEDSKVNILADHKMTKTQVQREVEAAGFRLERIDDRLPIQHLFIFRKP